MKEDNEARRRRQGRPAPKDKEGYFALHPEACTAKPRDPTLPWVPKMRTRTVRRWVEEGKLNRVKE